MNALTIILNYSPDDLTSDFSIVQDIRDGMSKEDRKEVEIIGWLYQFYISEKKDEVFASNEKVKGRHPRCHPIIHTKMDRRIHGSKYSWEVMATE